MRQNPDDFGDRELSLIYVARKLNDALRVEDVLTAAGVDYAVEADQYSAGFLFRRPRVGAFFYVPPEHEVHARAVLRRERFTPFEPESNTR
jgi:hypothetical protein